MVFWIFHQKARRTRIYAIKINYILSNKIVVLGGVFSLETFGVEDEIQELMSKTLFGEKKADKSVCVAKYTK